MPRRMKLGSEELKLLLLYADHLSYAEVGREMNMSRQAVFDRVKRHMPILLKQAGIESDADMQFTVIEYRRELMDYLEYRIDSENGRKGGMAKGHSAREAREASNAG